MVKDRYGNGVEAYARRSLLLARADMEKGYLSRSEYGRILERLQEVILQYEMCKTRIQKETPKA